MAILKGHLLMFARRTVVLFAFASISAHPVPAVAALGGMGHGGGGHAMGGMMHPMPGGLPPGAFGGMNPIVGPAGRRGGGVVGNGAIGINGLGAVGGGGFYGWGGYAGYGGYGFGGGFGGGFGFAPQIPGPFFAPQFLPWAVDRGMLGGPLPGVGAADVPRPVVRRVHPTSSTKSTQLQTIGDRLFRAGNFKRATERYQQAAAADPDAATPKVRLAQTALVRGQVGEAARLLRDAVYADAGFLTNPVNIRTIYGEPAEFNRQVAKLESKVQADPADRDAWFVLGAELYLSGQVRRAGDVFTRLSNQKMDYPLSEFLDATDPQVPARR